MSMIRAQPGASGLQQDLPSGDPFPEQPEDHTEEKQPFPCPNDHCTRKFDTEDDLMEHLEADTCRDDGSQMDEDPQQSPEPELQLATTRSLSPTTKPAARSASPTMETRSKGKRTSYLGPAPRLGPAKFEPVQQYRTKRGTGRNVYDRTYLKVHGKPDMWYCHVDGCDKSYSTKHDLDRHHLSHGPKKFQCAHEGCGKLYIRRDALLRHGRMSGHVIAKEPPATGSTSRFRSSRDSSNVDLSKGSRFVTIS